MVCVGERERDGGGLPLEAQTQVQSNDDALDIFQVDTDKTLTCSPNLRHNILLKP
jgi:hypothetical protein